MSFQKNNTAEECRQLSQQELVTELKQKGTYNPDLMAWDASGIIRFLDRSIGDQYEVSVLYAELDRKMFAKLKRFSNQLENF